MVMKGQNPTLTLSAKDDINDTLSSHPTWFKRLWSPLYNGAHLQVLKFILMAEHGFDV